MSGYGFLNLFFVIKTKRKITLVICVFYFKEHKIIYFINKKKIGQNGIFIIFKNYY